MGNQKVINKVKDEVVDCQQLFLFLSGERGGELCYHLVNSHHNSE